MLKLKCKRIETIYIYFKNNNNERVFSDCVKQSIELFSCLCYKIMKRIKESMMKKHSILNYLYIYYASVLLLYIINLFMNHEVTNYIIGILALFMLIISFFGATRLFKILGSSFLIVGGYLYTTTGQSWLEIPNMLTSNLSLLALLSMLPWMNSVVRSGRFDRNINQLLKVNASDLGVLYARSSATTLTLASFLNLSAASISQDVLKGNLSTINKKIRDKFISMTTLRGFTLALLWSPLEIMVAVSITTTGVSYISLLPWLLLISCITFGVDSLWGRLHFKKYPIVEGQSRSHASIMDTKKIVKKIGHLMIALSTFLALVISLGNLLNLDFILTVTLLILPFAFIWSVLMKRKYSFLAIGWPSWKKQTNNMQNFSVLFISLSFFSNSISGTSFLEIIQKPFLLAVDYPLAILIMLQILFIILSMFGIHPIATVGILTGVISPLLAIMNPLSIAIVLITGSIATLTVGTYGLVVTLTSMNTGQNPYRITWNNMPFALMYGSIGTIIAYFLL